jgi:hypothetical protein
VTFSLAARCGKTGRFGIAVTSSSPAVAARCAHARAGVGAAASQNITDPSLGRRLLAYARDLLNSDYAGHRLTFQLFAQSPPFSHLLAVYNNYDFEPATELMCQSAGIKTIDGRNR